MTEENYKVSIIIPVYNTAPYLTEAINSVLRQTLREIQIICVNDGSTDNSLQILQKLASGDSRIQIYNQNNSGQSEARNEGIKHATGKYIYFMDSDDCIENNALELCYDKAERTKSDFVCFDTDILDKGIEFALVYYPSKTEFLDENKIYSGSDLLNIQLKNQIYSASVCLHFILKKYYLNHHFSFYPQIIHEDQLFTCKLYIHADRVVYIAKAFFHRRFRPNSTMTKPFKWKNIQGYLIVTNELIKEKRLLDEDRGDVIDDLLIRMLNAAVWQAYVLPLRQRIKLGVLCRKRYKKYVSTQTLIKMLLKSFIS